MDLCTVISEKFIPQAINLIQSYKVNSFDEKVYVYHFNTSADKLNIFKELFSNQVTLRKVLPVCAHALEPRVFFYKVYAINDCLVNNSKSMIYSDSTNCFINKTLELESDLQDGALFLPYRHPGLSNQYWTTKKCFKEMEAPDAKHMPQYWAGFQVYKRTLDNIRFVSDMFGYMKNPNVALPDTTVKYPDGENTKCIEHRQDQSVLSILMHKHDRHHHFDMHRNDRYGDWQTIINFNKSYNHKFDKMILSPRESKFGNFRFLSI
jgi:hypothetical protein